MSFLVLAASFTEVRPGLIFWTIVTFVILLVVLRMYAWKPILDLVQEREKQIANAIESAKRERAEAEKLLSEQKAAIAEARRESAELLRRNQADMEKFREEVMAKSQRQAEEELKNARRRIQEERDKAVAEVKGIAVDLAIDVAQKLLGEKLDDTRQRKLAEQFIAELPKRAETEVRG